MKPYERNQPKRAKYTLQEAMQLVLREAEGNQMHAADLAKQFIKRLIFQKDGSKAEYNQIRADAGIIRICSKRFLVILSSLKRLGRMNVLRFKQS